MPKKETLTNRKKQKATGGIAMESVIRQQTTNHGKNRFTTRIREEVQPEPAQPEGKKNGKKGSSAPAASQNKSLEDESK